MKKHIVRAGLLALAVLTAACESGPTDPGEPKKDVDEGGGKSGLVWPATGSG